MSWKIAGAGVAGAAALGLFAGSLLQPTLASRNEGPIDPLTSVGESGPADLTPPYVGPQSLRAWRIADAAPVAPDPIEREVRRDLARANLELRASEAALEQYHRTAVLVRSAVDVADHLGGVLSDSAPGPRASNEDASPEPLLPAPPLPRAPSDVQLTRY